MNTPMTAADYAELLPYATPAQAEAVEALLSEGTHSKAAGLIGIHPRKFEERLERLRRTAAMRGHSPAEDAKGRAPEGYHVRGKSTLYDADGQVRAQWVKTALDDQARRFEDLKSAAEELGRQYRAKKAAAPRSVAGDLMAVVPMGDPHVGLYCWADEVGSDFDLAIARDLMRDAVERLVQSSPACGRGLLLNLGDFFHSDTDDNRTKRSGNALDVDTRWSKVLRVGLAAMKAAIDLMLRRHSQVTVINNIGNHDDHSSQFLSLMLAEAYANEPRVTIVTDPVAFHYVRFGKVLLGTTHGHTVKADQLPGIMAYDRAADWGETIYRHWYVGHVHHKAVMDYPGCTVEYCRSLVARDAWTTAAGYRAYRDMRCIVYHKEHGEVEAHRVGVETLQ